MPLITPQSLQAATGCSPVRAAMFAPHLVEASRLFEIDTPLRVAAFVAQMAHESENFTDLDEDLGYRRQRLIELGAANGPRSRWAAAAAQADRLAHNPKGLANFVYARRMGNGDEASGDGWRYRGRGLKNVTGRANYEAITEIIQARLPDAPDFVKEPDLLTEPRWAALSAGAFWHDNELNELADAQRFTDLSVRVNGGKMGLNERRALYRRARAAFGVK